MENEKLIIMVNGTLIRKLKSMSQDLKTYININVVDPDIKGIEYMSSDDIKEIIEIRHRIKKLAHKLAENYKH
jgi:phosphopantetheine adenylyltransferase